MPQPIRDRAGAREYFNSWVTAFPDISVSRLRRVIEDDQIAGEIEFTGTNTGPMVMGGATIPATGRSVRAKGSYFATVRDGKVVDFSMHPDVAGLMMQLGLIPQPQGV